MSYPPTPARASAGAAKNEQRRDWKVHLIPQHENGCSPIPGHMEFASHLALPFLIDAGPGKGARGAAEAVGTEMRKASHQQGGKSVGGRRTLLPGAEPSPEFMFLLPGVEPGARPPSTAHRTALPLQQLPPFPHDRVRQMVPPFSRWRN